MRDAFIGLKVTDGEKALFEAVATVRQQSLSEFLREAARRAAQDWLGREPGRSEAEHAGGRT